MKLQWTAVGSRISDIIPSLLFACSLTLYAQRLSIPANYVFDEVYHAYTAGQYAAGNHDAYLWNTQAPRPGVAYAWNHPPVGLLIISASILIWGDNSFGWRFANALFGSLGIVVAYFMAYAVTGRRKVAVLTSLFLLVDGLYFVQSRVAMLDIFGAIFMLGALLSFYRYLRNPAGKGHLSLFSTGLLMGLAVSTKWSAAFPALFIGLVALHRVWRTWKDKRTGFVHVLLYLIALPLTVYLASYIPFFLARHDLSQFVELQKQIFYYHSGLKATHPYQSSWWKWPLAQRPVWYYTSHVGDKIASIYAFGNPLLYWSFLPAVIWLCLKWRKGPNARLVLLLIGFFGQWLPWALVPRIAFMYHFLPAVPFGALAVAFATDELGRRKIPRCLAILYVLAVILVFIYLYPVYAGVPSKISIEALIWPGS